MGGTTQSEKLLLMVLQAAESNLVQATVLQTYIARNGPLSETMARRVRSILAFDPKAPSQ